MKHRIAVGQMCSTANIEENFKSIEQLLEQAKSANAVCLAIPEECLTLGMSDKDKLKLSKQSQDLIKRLSQQAKHAGIWLVAGTIPVEYDQTHFESTCIVFDPMGEICAQYQKIHLFDVSVADGVSFRESNTVKAGDRVVALDAPFGKMGLSICYDLRFPNLYQHLSNQGVQIIFAPSAFTPQTGELHWEVLLKARAIENLCYVCAPNQNGVRDNGEGTYGHSCIISPWGEVLASHASGESMIYADIDLDYLQSLRTKFPVLEHKRIR